MGTAYYDSTRYANPYIDALVDGDRWTTGDTVRLYLDPTGGSTATDANGIPAIWQQAGAADALQAAMASWNAVCDIHLTLTTNKADADYYESIYRDSDTTTLGEHYFPSNDPSDGGMYNAAADVFTTASNAVGGYSYVTFVHELGHALGLDHPFDGAQTFPGIPPGDTYNPGDYDLNSTLYTVMSYNDDYSPESTPPSNSYGWMAGPMAFDIAAVQALYGANMSTATGDNTYDLPTINTAGTYYTCIWDAGGTDTISGANAGSGCHIDLRAASLLDEDGGGGWGSDVNGEWGGFTIANGVVIEDAVGSTHADTITGNDANNIIDGDGGDDTLTGGGGLDTFIIRPSDSKGEEITDYTRGTDTLDWSHVSGSYLVVDHLVPYTYDDAEVGLFDSSGLIVTALSGDFLASDLPDLPTRYDVQIGLPGPDETGVFHGGSLDDIINVIQNTVRIDGEAGNDRLTGGSGNDTLDGGAGADRLEGGSGDNTYYVDNIGDRVVEYNDGGTDLVISSLDAYSLPGNVENLSLSGPAALDGTGNALANVLTGSSSDNYFNGHGGADTLVGKDGNDTLDGGSGNDTLVGGKGDDCFFVQDDGDVVVEKAGQGTDSVISTLGSYTLGVNVENLTLGGAAAINGTGSKHANILTGNNAVNHLYGMGGADKLYGDGGSDTLDGGTGADTMVGGTGDDTYYVQNSGDMVTEASGQGVDTVISTLTNYTLGANVENLTLAGTAAIDGTGSKHANILTGNDAANHLSGMGGADTLYGNGGDDVLDGGTGADTMVGGAGNDTFYVQNGYDKVVEKSGQGTDTVISSAHAYTLANHVEDLTLAGSGDIDGTGNSGANVIVGNEGNNLIDGAGGQDLLTGGGGHDTFVFAPGDFGGVKTSNCDRITDFTSKDRIDLSAVQVTDHGTASTLSFIGTAAFDGGVGELRTYQSGGNTYLAADLDGDKHADFLIRLDGAHTISAGELII